MKFQQKLKHNKFVWTLEVSPPKGTDVKKFNKIIHKYKSQFDAFNVTDNQRSVLHMSSLVASKFVLDNGAEPIFQLTCRDRNRLALQSDLLGASALGIHNILALTGDSPLIGDHPDAKNVFDLNSFHLLELIQKLNKGVDLHNHRLNKGTDFFTGGSVNPNRLESIYRMRKKLKFGAIFFQTQPIYDIEIFKKFMKSIKSKNVRIIGGIIPLKSYKNAVFLNTIPGIDIPKKILDELKNSKDQNKTGLEITIHLINQVKEMCHGIHLMTGNNYKIIDSLLPYLI